MMIARLVRIALLLAVTLLVSSQPARGSGGFGTSIAAFSTGACNDTGSREWVELTRTYGLLCGRPKHKSIELITVYAPGCDEGHLILRDLKGPDGRTILLFSAPANLMKKTVRATIYVKGHSKDLALLEHVEEDWKRHRPQMFRVAADDAHEGSQQNFLLAFSLDGLGLCCLQEQDSSVSPASSNISHNTSASSLLGGGISRGLLPLALSLVALLGGVAVSRWIHRTEQYAGK